MITPREAVNAAAKYYKEGDKWLVTLSYPSKDEDLIFGTGSRDYKQFIVDADGNVESMTIRTL